MAEMLRASKAGEFIISKANYAIIIGAFAYCISPVDLIPDIIPIVGWTDDILAIKIAFAQLAITLAAFREYKRRK